VFDELVSFWPHVLVGEHCWSWTGAIHHTGYGVLDVDGRQWRAHRLSYVLARGPVPDDEVVRHKCDNRWCVRPSHLETGTQADNIRDRDQRGRTARGERHGTRTKPGSNKSGDEHWARAKPERLARGERQGSAKLTEANVAEIRESPETRPALARRFGVTRQRIGQIQRGQGWKHSAPKK